MSAVRGDTMITEDIHFYTPVRPFHLTEAMEYYWKMYRVRLPRLR
jgi:hypothetical protein